MPTSELVVVCILFDTWGTFSFGKKIAFCWFTFVGEGDCDQSVRENAELFSNLMGIDLSVLFFSMLICVLLHAICLLKTWSHICLSCIRLGCYLGCCRWSHTCTNSLILSFFWCRLFWPHVVCHARSFGVCGWLVTCMWNPPPHLLFAWPYTYIYIYICVCIMHVTMPLDVCMPYILFAKYLCRFLASLVSCSVHARTPPPPTSALTHMLLCYTYICINMHNA